ncbi:MAG TPA: AAA family ATPase [Pedomonas sp.]|uniref:AAA family ATPase n=1 Tax=Pedomonas sp. TaxID=2976421 RepID=UPI002F42C2AC
MPTTAKSLLSDSADSPLPPYSLSPQVDAQGMMRLAKMGQHLIGAIRNAATDGEPGSKPAPVYQITKAAQLIGRTPDALRRAEDEGRIPVARRNDRGKRIFTLAEINQLREIFGTRPRRGPEDPLTILAVQNFKGGVGKSTISVHLAEYLALKGYRVLLIDCDSQASATSMFGYQPDIDLSEDDTLYPYLRGEMESIRPLIRKTHFDGLDLVPANLLLYQSEYELFALLMNERQSGGPGTIIDRIGAAIATVEDDYDIVILDPPPALGMISIGVMSAANALVVPTPPSLVDFGSTVTFLTMMASTMAQIESILGREPAYNIVRFVTSKYSDNKKIHATIYDAARQVFGPFMLSSILKDSAEIESAAGRMLSIYDLDGPISSHDVYRRCVETLDTINLDIERTILSTWPSRKEHAA